MRLLRPVLLALALASVPLVSRADVGGRIYLGPAAGQGTTTGSGGVLGFASAGGSEVVSSYWGLQLLGVQIGTGNAFLPLISVDGGFLWSPFPKGFLRPHASIGVGATFLLILPLPAITAAVGVGIPIGDLFVLDLNIATRAALNPFDTANNPRVLSIEFGVMK